MTESILTYFAVLCLMAYGLYRFALAIDREQEEKRRAGELAWQEWERRA